MDITFFTNLSTSAPSVTTFGALTAIDGGGVPTAEADGSYGEFRVLNGEILPVVTPLTVGMTTVGSTSVEVIAGVAHVKSSAQLLAAMESARPGGGRTIRCRGVEIASAEIASSGAVTPYFTAPVVIDSEPGHKFVGPLAFRHWRNMKLDGIEVHDPTGNRDANTLTFIGDCFDIEIDRCHIHGKYYDPANGNLRNIIPIEVATFSDLPAVGSAVNAVRYLVLDEAAFGRWYRWDVNSQTYGVDRDNPEIPYDIYDNNDVGIRNAPSGRFPEGGDDGFFKVTRTLIEDVQTGFTVGVPLGGVQFWYNEVRRCYNDLVKVNLYGSDRPVSFRYNYVYDAMGNPSDIGNPHVDMFQIISGTNLSYNGYEAIGNVGVVTNTSEGKDLQGIVSFEDSNSRVTLINPVIAGNIIAKSSNHNIGSMKVNGARVHYNTIICESPDEVQPSFQSILLVSGGTNSISIKGNLQKTGTDVTGTATDVFAKDNRIFNVANYNDFMAGPNFLSNVWAQVIASYAPKAGGPGVGFGAHEIMTFGNPREFEGWAVDETKLVALTADSVPDAFYGLQWAVIDAEVGNRLDVAINALPDNGGSAITSLEYRINGGAPVAFSAATTGTYEIVGLTNDVSVNLEIRAVNAIGASAWSDMKAGTPTLSLAEAFVFVAANSAVANSVSIPAHNAGDILIVGANRNAAGAMGNLATAGFTMLGADASFLVGFSQVSDGTPTTVSHSLAEGMTVAVYRKTTGTAAIGAVAVASGTSATSSVPALTLQVTDGTSQVVALRGARSSNANDPYAASLTQRANSAYRAAARGSLHDTNGGVASFAGVSGAESASGDWRTIAAELRIV